MKDWLFYKYKLVGEVEKDGKVYAKYKRTARFGGVLFIAKQFLKIVLVGVLAIVISHVLINTVFTEKKPGWRQLQK